MRSWRLISRAKPCWIMVGRSGLLKNLKSLHFRRIVLSDLPNMGDKAKGTPLLFATLRWRRLMNKIKENKRTQSQAFAVLTAILIIICIYRLNSQFSDGLYTLHSQQVPSNHSVSMVYLYCNASDPDYLDRRERAKRFVEEHTDSVYGVVPNKLEFSPQNDRGELKVYSPCLRWFCGFSLCFSSS